MENIVPQSFEADELKVLDGPGRFHRAVYTNWNLIPFDKLEMSDLFFSSASVYVCVRSGLMWLHQKDVFTAAAQPHVFQINWIQFSAKWGSGSERYLPEWYYSVKTLCYLFYGNNYNLQVLSWDSVML